MKDKGPDGYTMIGLHKLAGKTGDALVPELYQLLIERDRERRIAPNVVCFPFWAARLPGEASSEPLGTATDEGRNVIAFAQPARKTADRRKKV
ncbi:hypothetical protein DTW90_03275 [Neorhizobium sp. P12A]|jgi:hypothetical protein|uniref:hypothetical protein n=1 Tax=Neorhizobium sp. P12A TaxID=2268027 RepID=UPI0011EC80B5|nr:hypothetical protein [Neorhizobium sp. P12A]KAA0700674.1 hypothetical protein DTW90_03275 [Neorhizobium sp. P12A]